MKTSDSYIGNTYKCDNCGHWGQLPMTHNFKDTYYCSECGHDVNENTHASNKEPKTNKM